MRILIVEDDELVADALRRGLAEAGFAVDRVASAELHIGALTLDLKSQTAELGGQPLDVTRREWSILECLALDAGRVVRKEKLLRAIAGWDEELTPNAVEVYVSRLRAKLGEAVAIRTVRGLGYRLDDPAA